MSTVSPYRSMIMGIPLRSQTITVQVGKPDSTVDFDIHEEILRKHSRYFERILSKDHQDTVRLRYPEDDPADFEAYARWLYTGVISLDRPNQSPAAENNDERIRMYNTEMTQLGKLFALGHILISHDFSDAVLDAIISRSIHYKLTSYPLYSLIYPHTDSNSPSRKLAVDMALWDGPETILMHAKETNGKCPGFVEDLLGAFTGDPEKRTMHLRWWEDSCRYHEHRRDGKPWCREKVRTM